MSYYGEGLPQFNDFQHLCFNWFKRANAEKDKGKQAIIMKCALELETTIKIYCERIQERKQTEK